PRHHPPLQAASSLRFLECGPAEERSGQDPEARPARALLGATGTSGELMEPGIVTVYGSAAGFAQEITVGQHRLTGDMPAAAGGNDTGPEPYDFLLAALGSCISITVAMYARRNEGPLGAVTVRPRHSRIYAIDCEECQTTEGLLDQIECEVEFTGVLSDEQRARLLEIANKCPVHRTLTSEISIRTRLLRQIENP